MVRVNPCSYKKECRSCKLVGIGDRPILCSGLECEFYTPCKKCGKNLDLNKGICKYCIKKNEQGGQSISSRIDKANAITESAKKNSFIDDVVDATDDLPEDFGDDMDFSINKGMRDSDIPADIGTVTMPGSPMPHYNEDAKRYYLSQWAEYSGYYSDPTVYYIVHQIIIIEIELSMVSSTLSKFISDDDIAPKLEKRRDKLIANLASLRRQLPERDALELSDDEKSMSMIYKRYSEEKLKDTFGSGPVRRVLTPDAYALAPVLHFRIDPLELLKRLGYKIADPDFVAKVTDKLPMNPFDAAEFYGFKPREKYAMDVSEGFERIKQEDDEDDIEEDTHGFVV